LRRRSKKRKRKGSGITTTRVTTIDMVMVIVMEGPLEGAAVWDGWIVWVAVAIAVLAVWFESALDDDVVTVDEASGVDVLVREDDVDEEEEVVGVVVAKGDAVVVFVTVATLLLDETVD
jgi:hypothetical protein